LKRNGLVCGVLPSVDTEYPLLERHLKEVIQAGKIGVEAIFNTVVANKGKPPITINSITRHMARIGTLSKAMQTRIPLDER
jgi:hypothetical protein